MIKYVGGPPAPESRGPVERLKGWAYCRSVPIEVGILLVSAAVTFALLAVLQSWGVIDAVNQILGG